MDSELIEKWIEYHSTKNKELFWAWEKLDDMVQHSPEDALEHILQISTSTNDPVVLSNLGAGPLEDFLVLHGAQFISQIEIKARQIPQFTRVVKSVWQNAIQPSTWERISAIQAKYS